jgi:hypothetical protein
MIDEAVRGWTKNKFTLCKLMLWWPRWPDSVFEADSWSQWGDPAVRQGGGKKLLPSQMTTQLKTEKSLVRLHKLINNL